MLRLKGVQYAHAGKDQSLNESPRLWFKVNLSVFAFVASVAAAFKKK